MGKEILNKCYCGNTKKSSCKIEKNNLCSICEKQGIPVKSITVKHMVLDELTEQVGDNDYFLCMSEECDITYYNTESKNKFNKQQVKVPIWFKNDANPKYACYCSEVTEEEVINAVVKHGAIQYENDAEFIKKMSSEISHGSSIILNAIEQTNVAIEVVSLTAQQSAENSEGIFNNVDDTTKEILEVLKLAQQQSELAEELNLLIKKFEI